MVISDDGWIDIKTKKKNKKNNDLFVFFDVTGPRVLIGSVLSISRNLGEFHEMRTQILKMRRQTDRADVFLKRQTIFLTTGRRV